MKLNTKSKLIIIGILFALLPIITTNLSYITDNSNKILGDNDGFYLDKDNLKISEVSGKIHIDNNWTAAKSTGICTGNGTYSEPYVIEDLEIDGEGSGSCIEIENSDAFFVIENCTLFNSGTGIRFYNVKNGQIIKSNCSFNGSGISLSLYCDNNTISGNTANNNSYTGILLSYSDNNKVTNNTVNKNNNFGIWLSESINNIISGNTVNNNSGDGINVQGSSISLIPNTISGNVVNYNFRYGIFLIYSNNNKVINNTANHNRIGIYLSYTNYSTVMGNTANNNTNDGILLGDWDVLCINNVIANNTANYNTNNGIRLWNCYDNIVANNTPNYNMYGIYLSWSDYNTVSGNTLIGNDECITEENCQGNTFSDNGDCTYGEGDGKQPIPGYNLFFLLGILSVVIIVISKKLKKS